jgi:hypothetical protein
MPESQPFVLKVVLLLYMPFKSYYINIVITGNFSIKIPLKKGTHHLIRTFYICPKGIDYVQNHL